MGAALAAAAEAPALVVGPLLLLQLAARAAAAWRASLTGRCLALADRPRCFAALAWRVLTELCWIDSPGAREMRGQGRHLRDATARGLAMAAGPPASHAWPCACGRSVHAWYLAACSSSECCCANVFRAILTFSSIVACSFLSPRMSVQGRRAFAHLLGTGVPPWLKGWCW